MTHRRPLVAGNWKLNGSRSVNQALLAAVASGLSREGLLGRRSGADASAPTAAPIDSEAAARLDVVICPPFVYLADLAAAAKSEHLLIGAQDVAAEDAGAFTGEIAASMLVDVGCQFVIVGHSERRAMYGDTDDRVARKVVAALAAGLQPIVCVGETLAERDSGQTLPVVRRQLGLVLGAVEGASSGKVSASSLLGSLTVAYEPVWAIGTGRTATPAQAQEVHADLRDTAAQRDATMARDLRILYGGSVKASNAKDLFAMQDIDGGLIGGASLQAADFVGICKAAAG